MKLIYSKIEPSRLLHLVHRLEEIESLSTKDGLARINVAPEEEHLQLATLHMDEGRTFIPHKHIYKEGEKEVIAQAIKDSVHLNELTSAYIRPLVFFGEGEIAYNTGASWIGSLTDVREESGY